MSAVAQTLTDCHKFPTPTSRDLRSLLRCFRSLGLDGTTTIEPSCKWPSPPLCHVIPCIARLPVSIGHPRMLHYWACAGNELESKCGHQGTQAGDRLHASDYLTYKLAAVVATTKELLLLQPSRPTPYSSHCYTVTVSTPVCDAPAAVLIVSPQLFFELPTSRLLRFCLSVSQGSKGWHGLFLLTYLYIAFICSVNCGLSEAFNCMLWQWR